MGKLKQIYRFTRCLLPSMYINFRYLPFCQAVKLPILVHKPHFLKLGGKIIIDAPKIYTGMIRLGIYASVLFPNNGFSLQNEGIIIFKGSCRIGNDCNIVCGKQGKIVFGENFTATAGAKIVSQHCISFGKNVLVGWSNIIIDTNFHPLYDIETDRFKKAFGEIRIGNNNWLASQCMTLPGVITPEHCIFGARTVITRGRKYESFCLYGGSPIKKLSRNVMLISGKTQIKDYTDTDLMMGTIES